MSAVVNWVKKNPTLVYSVFATAVPLLATYGVNLDQEKVLGTVSAALFLLSGVLVRKSNLKATAEALAEVPEGYLKQSDLFPQVEYAVPENDMAAVDKAEGASL